VSIAVVAVSIALAAVFGAGGIGLLAGAQPFAGNMDRLGVPMPIRVLVGVAEVAAAVGLLVGLAVTPLNVAAAAGLVALMIGALTYHARAKDPVKEYAPAVVLGLLSTGLLVLHATA
jgi:uncharacterized membrane protein YphA (DoxX/SURF4 family)